MTDRLVLLVDGPHAGEMIRMTENCQSWVFADAIPAMNPWPFEGDDYAFDGFKHTTYHVQDVPVFGRAIRIGWSSYPVSMEACAEWLLSDAAKQASSQ